MAKKRIEYEQEQNFDLNSLMGNGSRTINRPDPGEGLKEVARPNYLRFSKEKVIEEIMDSSMSTETKMILIRVLVKAK